MSSFLFVAKARVFCCTERLGSDFFVVLASWLLGFVCGLREFSSLCWTLRE